jgi:Flp pilus assembly pilin Flp
MVTIVRRFLRNKRGVTPVLSNVLLTVVAVAAMSLAASATYVITDNMHQIMGERVIAEDVWFTSDHVSIYLRNIGKVAFEVSSVYVNFTSSIFTPLKLEAGEHGWLNVTFKWDADALYHINVVTGRGTKIVDYYKAPS